MLGIEVGAAMCKAAPYPPCYCSSLPTKMIICLKTTILEQEPWGMDGEVASWSNPGAPVLTPDLSLSPFACRL